MPPTLRHTLKGLWERSGGALALVSGRSLADMDLIFAPLQLPAIGGHGAEFRPLAGAIRCRDGSRRSIPPSPGLRVHGYLLEASRQTPRIGQTPPLGLSHLEGELEPRIAGRLSVTPELTILAAAGLYSQPPRAADLSAVFGTPSLEPETSYHATLGETVALTSTLSLETAMFYKRLEHLIVRDASPTPKLAAALLEDGVGRTYGLQMMLRQQPWHGLFGWIAYTISRSERRDTPDSPWRLFDDDESHVLTAVGTRRSVPGRWGCAFAMRAACPERR